MSELSKCLCGRDAARVHCPTCGSRNSYAKASLARLEQTSSGPLKVMVYHCRACGIDFDDIQRASCKAPPANATGRQRKLAIKIDETMSGLSREERMKIVHDRLRGIKSTKEVEKE